MKPSHLRPRIWPQPLVILRRPYPISCPTHSGASRCVSSQLRSISTRQQQLRTPRYRAFASQSRPSPEISSAARSTISRTTLYKGHIENTSYRAIPESRSISSLTRQAWRAEIHSRGGGVKGYGRRDKSTTSKSESDQKPVKDDAQSPQAAPETKKPESHHPEASPGKYLNLGHLPKMPHRPTKEELLAAATGFFSRLKARFKWFSIRSARPWNVDDWSAFVSWFVLGNIVWILVGTTTFFSLVILSINTVVAQGMLSNMEVVICIY
jgi:distribution and morphology protein 31